jgi:hypothetical protein
MPNNSQSHSRKPPSLAAIVCTASLSLEAIERPKHKVEPNTSSPKAAAEQGASDRKHLVSRDWFSEAPKSGEAVFCTARMHVDADGCPRAYNADNTGIEDLGNAKKKDGSLSPSVFVFSGGKPRKQGPGDPAPSFYVSKTSLTDTSKAGTNPAKYVDALTVPYIVLPGGKLGAGRVGDVALVIDLQTGNRAKAVVADAGPPSELGEASIFCAGLVTGMKASDITEKEARRRGSFINPRKGGTEKKRFRYIVFPERRSPGPKPIRRSQLLSTERFPG